MSSTGRNAKPPPRLVDPAKILRCIEKSIKENRNLVACFVEDKEKNLVAHFGFPLHHNKISAEVQTQMDRLKRTATKATRQDPMYSIDRFRVVTDDISDPHLRIFCLGHNKTVPRRLQAIKCQLTSAINRALNNENVEEEGDMEDDDNYDYDKEDKEKREDEDEEMDKLPEDKKQEKLRKWRKQSAHYIPYSRPSSRRVAAPAPSNMASAPKVLAPKAVTSHSPEPLKTSWAPGEDNMKVLECLKNTMSDDHKLVACFVEDGDRNLVAHFGFPVKHRRISDSWNKKEDKHLKCISARKLPFHEVDRFNVVQDVILKPQLTIWVLGHCKANRDDLQITKEKLRRDICNAVGWDAVEETEEEEEEEEDFSHERCEEDEAAEQESLRRYEEEERKEKRRKQAQKKRRDASSRFIPYSRPENRFAVNMGTPGDSRITGH